MSRHPPLTRSKSHEDDNVKLKRLVSGAKRKIDRYEREYAKLPVREQDSVNRERGAAKAARVLICEEFDESSSEEIRHMLSVVFKYRRTVERPQEVFDTDHGLMKFYNDLAADDPLVNEFGAILGVAGPEANYQTDAMAEKREEELNTELKFIKYGRLLRKTRPDLRALHIIEGALEKLKNGEEFIDDLT
eukprot:CAMPEP_0117051054 /NCGR_PEP_ID=MMETSP0472-20121206/35254_1 /TAXON_ID=693140 ORGANISM="Tiarina fusus, Strain LIS" /NCGR_SAMPLE_ID=MMETSP0472 /ASSEMBLY_ACC=CAM_ASM_000603 /LENGTH=189 /DNA_ID=CAMNT_0004765079 /DNA_START=68 /DNA_END=637 /DNA_ORIENTATION=+